MAGFLAPIRALPGAQFDQTTSHLNWMPPELRAAVHDLILPTDKIVVTSKNVQRGPMQRILPPLTGGQANTTGSESTFGFSTTYSTSISNKVHLGEYRWTVQKYIINEMQCIQINIEDFQFTNALKLLKTLEKSGKLQDFLLRPDDAGTPNRKAALRGFFFKHRISKNFSGGTDRIEKWSKQVEKLSNGAAIYHMQHEFVPNSKVAVEVVDQCVCDLGTAGLKGCALQRDIIARALRSYLRNAASVDRTDSRMLMDQEDWAQGQLEAFRREVEEEHGEEAMGDYDDDGAAYDNGNDGDEEMPDAVVQGTWGTMGSNFPLL